MKIKPLLEKLRQNWPAKAICIFAACLFYIFNRYTSLEQKSLPVSLKVIQDGEMVSSSHIPSSVSVTIKTSNENISKITSTNISAQLDLSYITQEGNYNVPVSLDLPSNIIEMTPLQVTVYPEKIKVHLERNTIRAVKILPQLSGKITDGYVIESVSSEPEYMSIYGPRSIVESIDSISTEGIIVEDKTQTFKQKTKIVNLNKLVKLYGSDETLVTVKMDYQEGERELQNLPILLRNIPANFECDTQKKASILLRGPRLIMNEWTPNPDTLSVDLSEITEAGDYKLPVSVLIPQEFHLESLSVDTIDVKIKERPPAEVVDETLQTPQSEEGSETIQ